MKLEKLLVVMAGGTICGRFQNDALVFDQKGVVQYVEESGLESEYYFQYHALFLKNSSEVTDEDRQILARTLEGAVGFSKVVILFGTDPVSVAKTIDCVRQANIEGKTIVFVGADQPFGVYNSDAPARLGMALGILAVADPGVYSTLKG